MLKCESAERLLWIRAAACACDLRREFNQKENLVDMSGVAGTSAYLFTLWVWKQ